MPTVRDIPDNSYILIHTDGACSGNPGPGGWGATLRKFENETELHLKRISGADPATTNNRMEMTAAIAALKAIKNNAHGRLIIVHSDSNLLIQGMKIWLANWKRNGWRTADRKPVKNDDLWQALDQMAEGKNLRWEWVKGIMATNTTRKLIVLLPPL